MRIAAPHLILALVLPVLAACSGPAADQDDIATRVARAASRTVVDAIMEIEEKSGTAEPAPQPAQPLAVAASRPDSILDRESIAPLESLAAEAMTATPTGIVTMETARGGNAASGHVITATVLSDFMKKCEEEKVRARESIASRASNPSLPAAECTIARGKRGNLTRI